jgi:hypothetical protein
MDWRSASDAERVCDCGDGVQWPNERNPICFMPKCNNTEGWGFQATRIKAHRHLEAERTRHCRCGVRAACRCSCRPTTQTSRDEIGAALDVIRALEGADTMFWLKSHWITIKRRCAAVPTPTGRLRQSIRITQRRIDEPDPAAADE